MSEEKATEATQEVAEGKAETAAEGSTPKKRFSRRGKITLGVVAAVVVVAAIGLFVWHEQPSFCSAICHTPMDPYLPTYEAEPGQPAVDKWGNSIPDAAGMMAATHRAEAGSDCMDCHVPTLGEQVSEGLSWASGNYEVYSMGDYSNVLKERSLAQLTSARGIASEEFCLNPACHDLTREELEAKTADRAFNPHASDHGTVDCGTCHKAHRQSVMYCSKCHDAAAANIPDGWISYQEAQALEAM